MVLLLFLAILLVYHFHQKIFSYVNIKRPTCVVGQVYTKITIKPSLLDKRKISTHDSISAAIV